jgi:hypothetical protein
VRLCQYFNESCRINRYSPLPSGKRFLFFISIGCASGIHFCFVITQAVMGFTLRFMLSTY